MSYTEIPTALLVEAGNLLPHMGYLFEQAEFGDIELTVDQDQMVRLLPLIRWLEYIEAKWSAEEILDEERQKLPPLRGGRKLWPHTAGTVVAHLAARIAVRLRDWHC